MLGGTQFVMHHTKVVDTTDEIHARLKGLQAMSGMTTSACQGGQMFAKGGIQSLNKGGVQYASPFRLGQQFLSPFDGSLCHAPGDLDHALLLGVLDHRGNQNLGPGNERASSSPNGSLHFLPESASNTARIRRPAISADQNWPQRLTTAANLEQQVISQSAIAS